MRNKGNEGRHSAKSSPKKQSKEEMKIKTRQDRNVKERIIEDKKDHVKQNTEKELDEIVVNIPVVDDTERLEKEESEIKHKKKKINKILKFLLVILITFLIVFVTIFARYLVKSGGNVEQAFKQMFKDAAGDQDPVFILVMGISEDISAELTDTLMLVGYNPDTNQAFVLSIPRDTYVGNNINNGNGGDKINALYQINKKNPQKTIEAVENITGVNIDYYVIVKTSVLVKIVDTLGGVDFDVPINMDYDDDSQDLHIHLKAGPQRLSGKQAEQLVRFRHNNNNTSYPASYGDNDEGRTRTQREFLKVVAEQVIQTRDLNKIKTIAKSVFDNLETNVKWDKAVGYIPSAMDFKMENLEMSQLPGEMVKTTLWFFKVDTKKSEEVINGYIDKLGLTDAEKKQALKTKKTSIVKSTVTTTKKATESTTEKKNTTTNRVNTTKNTTADSSKNTTVSNNKSQTSSNKSSSSNNKSNETISDNNESSGEKTGTSTGDGGNTTTPKDGSEQTKPSTSQEPSNNSGKSGSSGTGNSGFSTGGTTGGTDSQTKPENP